MLRRGGTDERAVAISDGLATCRRAVAVGILTAGKRDVVDAHLRRRGLCGLSDGEAAALGIEQPQTLAGLTCEWEENRPDAQGLCPQDGFGRDFEAFAVFKQHQKVGDITICGAHRRKPVHLVARDAATGLTELNLEWSNPATQREFGGDKLAYLSYMRAETRGLINVAPAKRA